MRDWVVEFEQPVDNTHHKVRAWTQEEAVAKAKFQYLLCAQIFMPGVKSCEEIKEKPEQ